VPLFLKRRCGRTLGATLSGGQKARLSLARACYADADVVLMDDCLAGCDARTAESLLNLCVLGYLEGKIRARSHCRFALLLICFIPESRI
jgi:ABC-type multidrug transport system ATPase subunit